MTISTTTARTTYNGNGITTVFTIPFRFLVNGDIVVVSVSAAGVETTKTLTTDYTLTGAGDDAGGSVTMLVAPANGTRLIIYRDTEIVQETDYISGDPFPAETHERALDRLTMIAQEISPNVDRAIRVPVGDSSSLNTTLPAAVDRLDKFIVFDATTGATELSTVTQTQVASAVAAAYSAGSTADAVTFLPAGVGAVARSSQSKMRECVSVFDFMTAAEVADVQASAMTINVSSKILAAHTAHKHIYYPKGTYWMGEQSTNAIMVDFYGLGDNITMECAPDVEFVCKSTASVIPKFFRLALNNNFRVLGTIKFRDTGYDYTINWRGAGGFAFEAGSATWGNINIDAIRGEGLVYPVVVYGGTTSLRVRGIKIGYLESYNCYYGFNCQNNGDEVTIGSLHSYLNYRPYYVYGCQGHYVTIFNRNNRGTSGAVNIARLATGVHTKNINVKYTVREMAVATTHVLINHIDLTGGTIQGVNLDLDIDGDVVSPSGYNPLRFVNYDGAAAETAAASSNYTTDIRVKGVCSSGANNVAAVASYVEAGEIAFARSRFFDFDSTITDNFRFASPASGANVKTYTPTWTGSVTNPAIGNGIQSGEYEIDDSGICHYSIYIQMGTTTTYGSGTWEFGLPFKSRRVSYGQLHTAIVCDASAGFYICAALVLSGNPGKMNVYYNGGSNIIGNGLPMAWASTDYITISGSYAL